MAVAEAQAVVVSTHSRPKAAGSIRSSDEHYAVMFQHTAARRRLEIPNGSKTPSACFNTQPPEGGWYRLAHCPARKLVSTHSRPKAAGASAG